MSDGERNGEGKGEGQRTAPGDTVREHDLDLPDGRILHVYDAGPEDALPVIWQHGTPNLGWPPEPLFEAAAELGVRWISFDRPGYGDSTANPDRTIASVTADVAALADDLHIDRFGVFGYSGGGPHALACAAALPDRVVAAVNMAGLAPFDAEGLDWFAGMGPTSTAALKAAAQGRSEKDRHEAESADTPIDFDASDWAALAGEWGWFGKVAGAAMVNGISGLIDDDLAYVTPWGVDLADIAIPVFLLHGADDRVVPAAHSRWLASAIGGSELRVVPKASHVSIALDAPEALRWLAQHAP